MCTVRSKVLVVPQREILEQDMPYVTYDVLTLAHFPRI